MSFDANLSTAPAPYAESRAAQRRSQTSRNDQAEKAFGDHLSEKATDADKRARADAREARRSQTPTPTHEKQTAPEPVAEAPADPKPTETTAPAENKSVEPDTSGKPDGTAPIDAATVAEAPTTQALKQDIALAAEQEVISIIAPEGQPQGEAGLPGEKKTSDTNGLTAKPETTEDAGLNEALNALKDAVGKKDANPTASTDTPPKTADEAVKAAAKAIADAAAQQAKSAQTTETKDENVLSLDGSKGRSIAQQLFDEARALKESKASATAIARTQEVAQSENAVGNRLALAAEKAVADVTETTKTVQNVNNLQENAAPGASDPLLTLDEMAEEATSETAERAVEAKPKAETKPAENASRPAVEANAAVKGAPQVQPANGATPELVVTQKVADVQGLTSTAAKPELAHLPQQSSQAVPIQTVGIHVARQAMRGQTQFDIRLDPPELGRIEVKLEIGDDGKMRAHMVAEKAETLDLLQRDQRQLERTMQQNGMKGFDGGLSFSLKDQGTGQGSAGNRQENEPGQWRGGEQELEAANDAGPVKYRQVRLGGVDVSV